MKIHLVPRFLWLGEIIRKITPFFCFWKPDSCLPRCSYLEVFSKKGVLKYFAKFIGKYMYLSLFFNEAAGLRPTTLLKKRGSGTGAFL